MGVNLNQKVRSKGLLWVGVICIALSLLSAAYAEQAVSITHNLLGTTDNGPTQTLTIALVITNNTAAVLQNAEIQALPIGPIADRAILANPQPQAVALGDIAASATVSVDFALETIRMIPQEEMNRLPLLWEIKYTDEAGQEQRIVAESRLKTSE